MAMQQRGAAFNAPSDKPATTPLPLPWATLLRRILALAAPTSALACLQAAAQLIETWLAARQGVAALAGWAVVLPFALLMQQMSTGAMGGGVVGAIARALGAGRRDEASAMVLHAVVIAVLGGLLFALLLAVAPFAVLSLVGGTEAAGAAATYAVWLFGLGAVPGWLSNTLASVLRGGGRHGLAAKGMMLAWLVYPALAWLLAEPLGMGLAGVGLAYAVAFWAVTLIMAVMVARGAAGFMPVWRLRLRGALFRQILGVGLIACGMAVVANLSTILVTAMLKQHGAVAVAAYGVAARLEFLMVPLAFGVGSALTALVGRAVGGGDWATARRIAWAGGGMALLVAGSVGLAVGLFPHAFAAAFARDPAVIAIATTALSIIGPAFGGFGLGMALYFAAMGAGKMKGPALAALARITCAVGLGWLLATPLGLGLTGQFIGVALGITAYGAITAASVRPGVWRG